MKGVKVMLLGIALILLGIAIGTMNFLAWCGGGVGILVVFAGLFAKDKD